MRDSHTLDGMTIFQWRARAQEIAEYLVTYAQHSTACVEARSDHWHVATDVSDARMVCDSAPCTCGLLLVLTFLVPTTEWVVRCPDKPVLLPTRVVWCQFEKEADCRVISMSLKLPADHCKKPHRVESSL